MVNLIRFFLSINKYLVTSGIKEGMGKRTASDTKFGRATWNTNSILNMFHKQSNSTFGKVSYANKQTHKGKDIHYSTVCNYKHWAI